jgi:urease accessory protein
LIVSEFDDRAFAFLSILQLTDSLFPSGMFTLSHGIESYFQEGRLNEESIGAIIQDLIRFSFGPSDGVAHALAHRAASTRDIEAVTEVDRRLTAVKFAKEIRESSTRTGQHLARSAVATFGGSAPTQYLEAVVAGAAAGNYSVASAVAKASLRISLNDSLFAETYAYAASCLSAAMRAGAIEHRQIQTGLHELKPVIAATCERSLAGTLEDMGGTSFLSEIMSMRHERAELRLFAS